MINWWYTKMEGPWAHYLSHFMGGFMLCTVVGHYKPFVGLLAGIGAAIAKEIIDARSGRGTPEVLAAVITTVGVTLAYGLL